MKVLLRLAFLAALVAYAGAVAYGPSNCVSLSRSLAGSCVISTNCEAHLHELDHFEFVFDCSSAKERDVVRHSFGVGGFDANEEFDTEVKCDACAIPALENLVRDKKQPTKLQAKQVQTPVLAKATPSKAPRTYASLHSYQAGRKAERPKTLVGLFRAHQAKELTAASASAAAQVKVLQAETEKVAEEADEKEQEDEEVVEAKETTSTSSKTVRYGPDACVSTFKSKEGHCVMKTDCDADEIKNYTFGLVCVDKVGAPVRHIFGKDSFDPEETFDTLIACEKCLGLEDIPDRISLNSQVMQLTGAVAGLGDLLKNISVSVEKLNEQVFADKKENDVRVEEASKQEEAASTEAHNGKADEDEDSDRKEEIYADDEQTDKQKSDTQDDKTEDAGKAEEEEPAAKDEEEAPAAKDANTTGTDTVEPEPEAQTLPELVKFHSSARRLHKHTHRAVRQHKHTRRGSLRHEEPVHHELKRADVALKHQEPRVVAAVAHRSGAARVESAEVVQAKAGVGMREQTRRLRAGMQAERQQATASSDDDDSEDAQGQADGDGGDVPPQYENAMQEQGNAPAQSIDAPVQSVNTDRSLVGADQQVAPVAYPSPSEEEIAHEQDAQNSYQRFGDEPDEDRNGFDSGDKFY